MPEYDDERTARLYLRWAITAIERGEYNTAINFAETAVEYIYGAIAIARETQNETIHNSV